MIMPADPQVGDVYFPENTPGFVFEQVRVKAVDQTVQGPRGPVEGAIIASELHQDGSREDKTFAPGYGEFFTGSGGDVEALALAVPIDKLSGPVPAELEILASGSSTMASEEAERGGTFRPRRVPPRLKGVMDDALARQSAFDVAQTALDLQLQYRPPGRDRPRTLRPLGPPPDRRREGRQRRPAPPAISSSSNGFEIESRTRSTPSTGLGSTPS